MRSASFMQSSITEQAMHNGLFNCLFTSLGSEAAKDYMETALNFRKDD
jgi:hypothetical protein